MDNPFSIEFCERVNGKGLFVNKSFKKYEVVYILKGDIKSIPDKYSIEIGKDKHITDKYGIYINHSFEPSVMINNCDIVSLKDINVGDEICFNYNKNETSMACPFEINGKMVKGVN